MSADQCARAFLRAPPMLARSLAITTLTWAWMATRQKLPTISVALFRIRIFIAVYFDGVAAFNLPVDFFFAVLIEAAFATSLFAGVPANK